MALLQNDDFAIWYLRTSYLANIKDGIGERLININPAVLNNPAFRAAGWSVNAAEIKRTYSPPIPTAFNSEYFQSPSGPGIQRIASFGDEEEAGGLVTGTLGNDTVGPGPVTRRRRRKEQIEDDDSSDLSDESEEDAHGAQRAAQQIRFAKMPVRSRADSSPIKSMSHSEGPEVLVTSPSRRSADSHLRRGSLGAVEAVKARARRDTTTSSEMSSENELDPSLFQRRQVNPRSTSSKHLLSERMREDAELQDSASGRPTGQTHDDSDAESIGSALSSDFGATADSASLINTLEHHQLNSSSPLAGMSTPSPRLLHQSPKKTRTMPVLSELPPPRPISVMQPTSLLTAAIKARKAKPRNPIEAFASLSGKGSPSPLWIRIYAPFSERKDDPIEMPLARMSKDGESVTVAEAIGLSLWRYSEERYQPPLRQEQLNVNRWALRMVEDGEVDFDFPALSRTRPVSDFTSNNNRDARGRSRERPYDEFALVEATDEEAAAYQKVTPQFTPMATVGDDDGPVSFPEGQQGKPAGTRLNPVLGGQPFATALNNTSLTPADQPAVQKSATPRMGVTKTLRIRYFDVDVSTQTMTMEIATDSYIAEILDHVCKRWNLDKAGFTLRVSGTATVAPLDRTVEALGARSELDLVRRRFGAGPVSFAGSPGSSSPSAPLMLDMDSQRKGKRTGGMHPLAQKQDLIATTGAFKRWYVTRKQLTSFTQGNQRVLTHDGDYLHILPADPGRALFDSGAKSRSIAFGDVLRCKVSSKHPKLVRIVVRRTNESKRYDFEARNAEEAQEIVDDLTREMQLARRL